MKLYQYFSGFIWSSCLKQKIKKGKMCHGKTKNTLLVLLEYLYAYSININNIML